MSCEKASPVGIVTLSGSTVKLYEVIGMQIAEVIRGRAQWDEILPSSMEVTEFINGYFAHTSKPLHVTPPRKLLQAPRR